jgi:FKBP-type peptidyl-prolyl cis-trans isomerase FklB
MKKLLTLALCAFMFASAGFSQDQGTLQTQKDKISYAIGVNIGKDLKSRGVEIDTAKLLKGIQDSQSGGKLMLTDEEMQKLMTDLRSEMEKKETEKNMAIGEENKKEGDAFLVQNKTKEGIKTTASGLQYKIITAGTGPKPALTDTVTTHYRGTLIDGTEFDSSYKRNEPVSFPVNGVIKGWTEALQLMSVGSKWQLFIPSELAYGARGAAGVIGPNETLIFEVELISIQPKGTQEKQ